MRWMNPTLFVSLFAFCATAALAAPVFAQPRTQQDPVASDVIDVATQREALRSTNVKAAATAAENLGKTKDPQALEALLDGLALGLHPRVAVAAIEAIAVHKDPRTYDAIVYYLRYRDPQVRAAAVRAVAAFPADEKALGPILSALADSSKEVRAAAIAAVQARRILQAIEPLLELLKRGDEAAVDALGALANPDVAKVLGDLIGVAPDALLAKTLGRILLRADFGPEAARVQVVRTLGKVPGPQAVAELDAYVQAIPENPPRQSRREAKAFVQARRQERGQGGKQP